MFPRPKDISKEFGGGRNIVPGQELESEEVRKARDAEYREALAKFKRAVGGELDPEEERAAEALYEAGMELFRQGEGAAPAGLLTCCTSGRCFVCCTSLARAVATCLVSPLEHLVSSAEGVLRKATNLDWGGVKEHERGSGGALLLPSRPLPLSATFIGGAPAQLLCGRPSMPNTPAHDTHTTCSYT